MSGYGNLMPGTGCLIVVLVLAIAGAIALCAGAWWLLSHVDIAWSAT